jgi:sodium transport system permease protein
LALVLQKFLAWLYPIDTRMLSGMTDMLSGTPYIWLALVFAVLPALCEEVAFRGFILSGLRDMGHPWRAILVSSVLFGVAHSIIQQSIAATILGVLLGYMAIRSGSLLCPIAFHAVHNGLVFGLTKLTPEVIAEYRIFDVLLAPTGDGSFAYRTPVVVAAALATVVAMLWFRRVTPPTETMAAAEESRFVVEPLAHEPAEREHVAT